MKQLEVDRIVTTILGDNGNQISIGNAQVRDSHWCQVAIQIKSDWFVAVIEAEFSKETLQKFYRDLLIFENHGVASFYTEYGYFGFDLRLLSTGNIQTTGACSKSLHDSAKLSFAFETHLESLDRFRKDIGNFLSDWQQV